MSPFHLFHYSDLIDVSVSMMTQYSLGVFSPVPHPCREGETMKRIKILHPAAKNPQINGWSAVDRQVKIDCLCLPIPFTYTGNSIYHRSVRGGNVSGFTGTQKNSLRR